MILFLSSEIVDDLRTGDRTQVHDIVRYHRDEKEPSVPYSEIILIRNYVKGKQAITFTAEQKEVLEGLTGHQACDNVCAQIISEAAARLQLLKWICPDEAVQEFTVDFFTRGKAKNTSAKSNYAMLRDGNSCAQLTWDNKRQAVGLSPEVWWDGNSGIFVVLDYEDPERVLLAVKEWQVYVGGDKPNYWRRIVFVAGEIQRWKSDDHIEWYPYQTPQEIEEGREWPAKWEKKNGDPLAPPIVHFPNAGNTTEDYGLSELSGGFIGAQDQLNDLQWVLSGAARFTGYQMYTIAGMRQELDKNNQPVQPVLQPGATITSTDPNTRFGVLPAGNLQQIIAAYEHKLITIARNARIPLHRLGAGNPPSGEALLRAEGPAIGKAERQIDVIRPRWATVAHRAVEIRNAFAKSLPPLDEDELIQAVMEEPDRRDKLSKSVIVSNLGEKISGKEALRIMEYTEEEADKIQEEIFEEAREKSKILVEQTEAAAKIAAENAPKPVAGGSPPADKGKPSPPRPEGKVKA